MISQLKHLVHYLPTYLPTVGWKQTITIEKPRRGKNSDISDSQFINRDIDPNTDFNVTPNLLSTLTTATLPHSTTRLAETHSSDTYSEALKIGKNQKNFLFVRRGIEDIDDRTDDRHCSRKVTISPALLTPSHISPPNLAQHYTPSIPLSQPALPKHSQPKLYLPSLTPIPLFQNPTIPPSNPKQKPHYPSNYPRNSPKHT